MLIQFVWHSFCLWIEPLYTFDSKKKKSICVTPSSSFIIMTDMEISLVKPLRHIKHIFDFLITPPHPNVGALDGWFHYAPHSKAPADTDQHNAKVEM